MPHALAVDDDPNFLSALAELIEVSGSTLDDLCGLSTRSVAELLVEVGDPRRMTEGGFARFNGTAPLPASSAAKRLKESKNETPQARPPKDGHERLAAVGLKNLQARA